MKKLTCAFLITFSLHLFSYAQVSTDSTTFSPINEEFSVETNNFIFQTQDWNPEERVYSNFSNGNYYYIFSQKPDNLSVFSLLIKFAIDNNPKEERFSAGQFQGKRFSFQDSEGFNQVISIVLTPKRLYIFHTLTEKYNEPDIERFLASIKLNGKLFDKFETIAGSSVSENKSSKENVQTVESFINKSLGEREKNAPSTNKDGNGTGFGQSTNSSATVALTILAKPKALYTDLARIYQISGNLPLKVTFMANGAIGKVVTINDTSTIKSTNLLITRLPFGLTNSAIRAAREIRFEPQKFNGVAQTVTKTVIYQFTLY